MRVTETRGLDPSTHVLDRDTSALAEHDVGHSADSDRALNDLIARFGRSVTYQIAQVYAWRGDNDGAIEWLDRGRVQRDGGLSEKSQVAVFDQRCWGR